MIATRRIRSVTRMALAAAPLAMCASLALARTPATPAAAVPEPANPPYTIQPGDVLAVSVWKEKELQSDVLVRPDSGLSIPLAGDIQATGRSVDEVRQLIEKGLKRYIPTRRSRSRSSRSVAISST